MKQVQYLKYLNNEKLLFFFSCYFFPFPNFHQFPLLFDYLYWIKPNGKIFCLTFAFVLLIILLVIPICLYNKIYRKLFVNYFIFLFQDFLLKNWQRTRTRFTKIWPINWMIIRLRRQRYIPLWLFSNLPFQ